MPNKLKKSAPQRRELTDGDGEPTVLSYVGHLHDLDYGDLRQFAESAQTKGAVVRLVQDPDYALSEVGSIVAICTDTDDLTDAGIIKLILKERKHK